MAQSEGMVLNNLLIIGALLVGVTAIDALARPEPGGALRLRSWPGTVLLWLLAAVAFGAFLAAIGDAAAALALALALMALFTIVSNAKCAVLGEPLVFSDLRLLGAVIKHPQFYLGALTKVQAAGIVLVLLLLPVLFGLVLRLDLAPHLAGIAISASGLLLLKVVLSLPPWTRLASTPDLPGDVARHGLMPAAVLYHRRWRASTAAPPPATPAALPGSDALLVIVQCESFADPVDLFRDAALTLPGLARARAQASLWGNLQVGGFGAYTMRTEFGVLFGRGEDELGFRRYDPYLTAVEDAAHALPAKLGPAGWHRVFVHPHDLRFYDRERVLRAGGFAELVGPEAFAKPDGRYVPDAAITEQIRRIVAERTGRTMVFAVTIENHGPWPVGQEDLVPQRYLELVRRGDTMLAELMSILEQSGTAATLVFYGDHRPSIPGVVLPGGDRHTPYVMVRFGPDAAAAESGRLRRDLTPAQLHHAVLETLATSRAVQPDAAANGEPGAAAAGQSNAAP